MIIEDIRTARTAAVTIKDVAAVMGVNPRTVSGELSVNGGTIPSLRIGKRILVPRERFLAWFDGRDDAPSDAPETAPAPARDPVVEMRARLMRALLDEPTTAPV